MDLEVWVASERRCAGWANDCEVALEDIRLAQQTLDELAAEGMFVPQRETGYLLEFVFETEADWQGFLDRAKAGPTQADPELLAVALGPGAQGVAAIDDTIIRVYRRVP